MGESGAEDKSMVGQGGLVTSVKSIRSDILALRGRGQGCHDNLLANGLNLITLIRRNMKSRLMRLWDRLMLRKRFLIEML
jgi:hypothetical protein